MQKSHGNVERMWGGSDALAHNMQKATTQSLYQETMIEQDAYMTAVEYDRHCQHKGRELVVHDKMSYQHDSERFLKHGEELHGCFMQSISETEVEQRLFHDADYTDYKAFKKICSTSQNHQHSKALVSFSPFIGNTGNWNIM